MRALLLLLAAFLLLLPAQAASGALEKNSIVLVLVDGLDWEDVERDRDLGRIFGEGASANLSTAQGSRPEDPRFGDVFIGAASRVNTAVLPEDLPEGRPAVADAFGGSASTVEPGSFGESLARTGLRAAAVGERAALVVMDREGRVPLSYPSEAPEAGIERALSEGAAVVAVEAEDPGEAGDLAGEALRLGAAVAVSSPNAPPGSPNLTPFAMSGPEGLLYSPSTRTEGLILNSDIAPTLLSRLGVRPPPEMEGRAAAVRPGTIEQPENLYERLAFVAAERFRVWLLAGVVTGTSAVALGTLRGREGRRTGVLLLATLPAAALLAALVPLKSALAVAALVALLAGSITLALREITGSGLGALTAVCLLTAALVTLDAALGGPLMRFSTLGYNPGYGARFYGVGNEYAAVLAGALPVGLGAVLREQSRRGTALLLVAGGAVVLVLALPIMGADVGGSLALGLGIGFTAGLLQSGSARKTVLRSALWAAAGLAFAALLFLASGLLFPDVSHGSRAAGEGSALISIIWRKLLLSLGHLLNPAWSALLLAGALVTYAGWRRVSGTPLGAGIAGGAVSAAASGALNDSGIFAALFALAYPAAAALILLLANGSAAERRPA